jgi:NHS family nucleoside permease-like MFS transporter
LDIVTDFPPIRIWGTIGFIMAMWGVSFAGFELSHMQLYIGAALSVVLAIFTLTLPTIPVSNQQKNQSWSTMLGLDAFALFKNKRMAIFFIFSMLLGAELQITNMFGNTFLHSFDNNPLFSGSFIVEHASVMMSISQISETLFILTIPFFLSRYGIKNVMLISIAAWMLRFGLFAYGDPSAFGTVLLVLSMIVYGCAFDFFNISGSVFVEKEVKPEIRASAQGMFLMMTNGFGAVFGSYIAGWAIDRFFTLKFRTASELSGYFETTPDNSTFLDILKNSFNSTVNPDGTLSNIVLVKNWPHIWLYFAAYALVIAILFALFFKHEHSEADIKNVSH